MCAINIVTAKGFCYYDIINMEDVVDLGDSYNIMTTTGDIFIDKDCCNIEYRDDYMIIYLNC